MISISVGTIKRGQDADKDDGLAGKLELVQRVANQRVKEGDAERC